MPVLNNNGKQDVAVLNFQAVYLPLTLTAFHLFHVLFLIAFSRDA